LEQKKPVNEKTREKNGITDKYTDNPPRKTRNSQGEYRRKKMAPGGKRAGQKKKAVGPEKSVEKKKKMHFDRGGVGNDTVQRGAWFGALGGRGRSGIKGNRKSQPDHGENIVNAEENKVERGSRGTKPQTKGKRGKKGSRKKTWEKKKSDYF